jgi:acetylornithine deacetylase
MTTMSPPTVRIDERYTTDVLQSLVRINSVNPSLSATGPGEAAIAEYLIRTMTAMGLEVHAHDPQPGRTSVVGRWRSTGKGRSLMLNGHIDTVAVDEMADPFGAKITDGRCYGRGAYDMKGSVAACFGAVKALRDAGVRLAGDLLIAAVADEEHASLGTADLVGRYPVNGAIVTEPTSGRLCLAHKGFVWLRITVAGKAAHGSQYTIGVDANVRAGAILTRLGALAASLMHRAPHPLVGHPSMHVPIIAGGTGMSTYAASATITIERRTIPGETLDAVVAEIQQAIDDARAADPSIHATVEVELSRESFEAQPDSPLVRAVTAATTTVRGTPPVVVGENPWMDSALLAAAGVDTVIIGPHGTGAHAKEEWVDVPSVLETAAILAEAAQQYCGVV